MRIRELWRRIRAAARARVRDDEADRLRAEVGRLRAENRALLNSILGIAGIPPIPADVPMGFGETPRSANLSSVPGSEVPPSGPGPKQRGERRRLVNGGVRMAAPTRRRSWQQITRMLELESSRKTAGDESTER